MNDTVELATIMNSPKNVLVVDDDKDVRETLVECLESLGFQVMQAEDGADAQRQLETGLGDLFAVFSDLDMPGLKGTKLLRMLVQLRSDAFRVLMSGRIGVDSQQDSEWQANSQAHALLAKPFTLARLREIKQLLEQLFAKRKH